MAKKPPAKAPKKPARRAPRQKKKTYPPLTIGNLKKRDKQANKGGAPIGNTNNKKYTTPEERRVLHKQLCDHLSAGYSRGCFPECDWDTVQRLCHEHPVDFPAADITRAIKAGRLWWETIGKAGTAGKVKNFNATSWKFNMQNRKDDGSAGDDKGLWGDKISAEISGAGGGPITTFDATKFSTPAAAKAAYDKMLKG